METPGGRDEYPEEFEGLPKAVELLDVIDRKVGSSEPGHDGARQGKFLGELGGEPTAFTVTQIPLEHRQHESPAIAHIKAHPATPEGTLLPKSLMRINEYEVLPPVMTGQEAVIRKILPFDKILVRWKFARDNPKIRENTTIPEFGRLVNEHVQREEAASRSIEAALGLTEVHDEEAAELIEALEASRSMPE